MPIPGVTGSSDGRQPSSPTIGSASAGDTTASVPFTVPSYLGKPGNNNLYTATSSPGSISATSTSTPISVTGLNNGTSYTFTVKAQTRTSANNIIATSLSSSSSNSVTPVAPPFFPFFPPFFPPYFPEFVPCGCATYSIECQNGSLRRIRWDPCSGNPVGQGCSAQFIEPC